MDTRIDTSISIKGTKEVLERRIMDLRSPSNGIHIQATNYDWDAETASIRVICPDLETLHHLTVQLSEAEPKCDGARPVLLKDVKRGDFVRRKADAKTTFTRGDYVRECKQYSLVDWEDINREVFLKGTTIVYIGFDF